MKKFLIFLALFFTLNAGLSAQDVTGTWSISNGHRVEFLQDGQNVYSIYNGSNFKHFFSGRYTATNQISGQVIRIDLNNNCRTIFTMNYVVEGNSLRETWRANDSNCDIAQGQTESSVLTKTTPPTTRPMNELTGSLINNINDVTGSWVDNDGGSTDWFQDGRNVYFIYNNAGFKHYFSGSRSGNSINGTLTRIDRSNNCRTVFNETMSVTAYNSMAYIWTCNDGACDVARGQRGSGTLARSGQTSSTGTTIALTDLDEWLCPSAVSRGDREFDGHGPRVKCEVTLKIGDAGRALYADIYIWAQETTSDWSTTERRWSKKVYDAPYGKTITSINSDKASRTQFVSPAAGFQFLVPGNDVASVVNSFLDGIGGTISAAVLASFGIPPGDFQAVARLITGAINNGNTVVRVPALEGTLVRFFHIVGDTGGPDISDDDNCNDDTRIVKLEFNPVNVTMR